MTSVFITLHTEKSDSFNQIHGSHSQANIIFQDRITIFQAKVYNF